MFKKAIVVFFVILSLTKVEAQDKKPAADSSIYFVDSTLYYEDLFSALEDFIDSLLSPRTMFTINAGIRDQFFNYETKNNNTTLLEVKRKMLLTPSVGYYHKTGLGITATAFVINDENKLLPYQWAVSGSYDYVKNLDFIAGVGFTNIFTKDSLSFYTSPLSKEVSAYFSYRDWWIRPTISASYGWGSRTEYEERKEKIKLLNLRRDVTTQIETVESISDFSVTASVHHDFYWRNVLGEKSYLRLSPQLSFISGTQRFGLNQTSNTYGTQRIFGNRVLANSENTQLDQEISFQPLSLAAFLRTELVYGKLYVQPQLMLDYYIPAEENNLNAFLTLTVGVAF